MDASATLLLVDTPRLLAWLGAWLWPLARITGLVIAAPVFGYRALPARVRIGLVLVLSLVVAPLAPPMPAIDPLSGAGLVTAAEQLLTGLVLGFAARLAFVVLEIAGQQIAQLMGLGFAALADPQNGIEVPVVGHFYLLLATLVYLGLDGHLVLIRVLVESFQTLPVAAGGVGSEALWAVSGQAGWVFGAGLLIALPAMAALLIVNLAFGVMARSAPQLNILAVGFPITLLFGLVVMLFSLPTVIAGLEGLFERALGLAAGLVGGVR